MRKIKFDEFDLLELFESEPTYVHGDEQAGVFMYSKKDLKDVTLVFIFDVYESYCEFSLNLYEGRHTICEYRVDNVKSLNKVGENLNIVSKDDNEVVKISFKPNITIGKVEM